MLPPAERGPILKPVIVTVKTAVAGMTEEPPVVKTIDVLAGALQVPVRRPTLLAPIVGVTLESKNPKG